MHDDTLRERLTETLLKRWRSCADEEVTASPEEFCAWFIDDLLPRIRDHVAAAVQAERERIAMAIDEAAPHMTVVGAHGMEIAARIARVDPEQVTTP